MDLGSRSVILGTGLPRLEVEWVATFRGNADAGLQDSTFCKIFRVKAPSMA